MNNESIEYFSNRGFWDNRLSVHELNSTFQNYINNNDLDIIEIIYSINDILDYFNRIKPGLEKQIIRLNKNILPNISEIDFDFDTNFETFKRYFESELELWENRNLNKSNDSIDLITENSRFTKGQKFILLKELGLFETNSFKKIDKYTQDSKHSILSEILGCDSRTAKGFMNSEKRFLPKNDNLNEVLDYLKSKEI